MNIEELKVKLDSLAVFSDLKEDAVVSAFRTLLGTFSVSDYSSFVSALYRCGGDLSAHIRDIVLKDENFYVRAVASGENPDDAVREAVKNELDILEDLAAVTPQSVQAAVRTNSDRDLSDIFLPSWKNSAIHLLVEFTHKLGNIHKTGYGIFARYTFFRVTDGRITPVAHPDCQKIDRLFGYERERNLIIKNTEALVSGRSASNMLLYGDMGTGKSSTVKAVAAAYSDKGIRLIEIKKNQLFQIPEIMDELASNPLKFILFIDDLSFAGNDDNFSALKATLEGSISGRSDNTVIYATSNRRHLVRESAGDRMTGGGFDDDLHLSDTLQETMSLAARFGLTITFQKPDKEAYLSIVRSLAKEYGIDMGEDELFRKAEAHAIRRNGRSPRTAKQFIELLKAGI